MLLHLQSPNTEGVTFLEWVREEHANKTRL